MLYRVTLRNTDTTAAYIPAPSARARATLFLAMTTVARDPKRASVRTKRKDAAPQPKPNRSRTVNTRGRAPSAEALEAHKAFQELQPFFSTRTDLARALGWSLPTLRKWFTAQPTRPRQDSARDLVQLRDLAVAAGKWVSDPLQAGEWLLAPHPRLRGAVPSRMAVALPPEGVALLVDDMALIAPQERLNPQSVEMSIDLLRKTLREIRAPTIAPANPPAEADLSDFDDID